MSGELTTSREQAIAEIEDTFKVNEAKLARVFGDVVTAKQQTRIALGCIRKSADLQRCSAHSIMECLLEAASQRWSHVGGPLAECYLVPFDVTREIDGRKRKVKEAVLIPSYRGYISLARDTGELKDVRYGLVYEGDTFRQPGGFDDNLIHEPSTDQNRRRKPVTHVWAAYILRDGTRIIEVWTAADIEQHRQRFSKAKDSTFWVESWEAMAIKTVLKQPVLRGRVPVKKTAQHLIERDQELEDMTVDGDVTSSVVEPIALPKTDEPEPKPEIEYPNFDVLKEKFEHHIMGTEFEHEIKNALPEALDRCATEAHRAEINQMAVVRIATLKRKRDQQDD